MLDTSNLPKKVVLHCPRGYEPELDEMVEQFMHEGVIFVGVVGADCSRVEDIIDELVVGSGPREPGYSMLTSSHPGETVAEAMAFAESLSLEFAGPVRVVEL